MRPSCLAVAALTAAMVLPASPVDGQIRASEPSTLIQTIDGTVFRVDYYRPRTRGRAPLFGTDTEEQDAVVWEHVWTPGANWATKFSFQKPIELAGVPVPAGTYSVWIEMDDEMIPEELFLDPDTLIFHTMGPARNDDQITIPLVMEDDAPFREVLTWDFEDYGPTGGTLALRWGTHRFPFEVKVEPSQRRTVTPEEAAPVEGTFEAWFLGPEGERSPTFTIRFARGEDEILHADWENVPAQGSGGEDEWFNSLDMWLLPAGSEGWFAPAESYEPGVLWDVWANFFFEFELAEDGPSPAFELRDEFDDPWVRGRRVGTGGEG